MIAESYYASGVIQTDGTVVDADDIGVSDSLTINGTTYDLSGAAPNVGSSSNRLGTVYSKGIDVNGDAGGGEIVSRMFSAGAFTSALIGRSSSRQGSWTWDDLNAELVFQTASNNFPIEFQGNGIIFATGTNRLEVRNGLANQSIYAYSTYTSSTSYQRCGFVTTPWNHRVATEKGSAGGTLLPLIFDFFASDVDPTTTDIGQGSAGVWHNTTSGEVRLWANVGGTLQKSAALTT